MYVFSYPVACIFRGDGYSAGIQRTKFLTIGQLVVWGHEMFNPTSLVSFFNYT